MNDIKIFENEKFGKIRTAGTSENPLFCLADVCKAVELSNPSSVKSRLDKDDVQLIDLHALNITEGTTNGNTMATFITESGFYDVVLYSKSLKVKPFRKWVTSEVLPTIRKTGAYGVPQTYGEALMLAAKKQLQVEEQQKQLEANAAEIIALNDKVDEMQPKATYYDQILKSKNTILVTQIAKDYGYSAQQFNKLLEKLHIQYKLRGQWILYAEHTGNGYTKSKSVSIQYSDGTLGTKLHTEWTQKGRLFLYEKLKANNILPLIEQ